MDVLDSSVRIHLQLPMSRSKQEFYSRKVLFVDTLLVLLELTSRDIFEVLW